MRNRDRGGSRRGEVRRHLRQVSGLFEGFGRKGEPFAAAAFACIRSDERDGAETNHT